jgi:hypothetical protein
MKILLSKESMAVIALLMLLSLSAVAGMAILVNAAVIKDPTVYVTGSGFVELTWKSGKSQTFSSDAYASLGGLDTVTIIPNHGWHITAVLIDGNLQEILDEDGFSLIDIRAKSMISVTFVENNGEDDVDLGSNVGAYPDPNVGLIFAYVEGEGWVYAETIDLEPPDAKSDSWNIHTTATFSGAVTIYLVCNLADLPPPPFDPMSLRLLRTEEELARADVNSDGMVDGTDVSIVGNANPSQLGDPDYDPRYDLDNDDDIDDDDVNIVNNYNNQPVWEDITLQVVVDDDLVYVYGSTDHFSIFGVH